MSPASTITAPHSFASFADSLPAASTASDGPTPGTAIGPL